MNSKKLLKWASNFLTAIMMTLLIGVAGLVAFTKISGEEPHVFGHQIKTVLSGSMEPEIKTGSVIAVELASEKDNFKKGDVITFQAEENVLITHRITEVIESGESILYKTKGDNNNAEDMEPVLSENVVAEYTGLTVPFLGYFISFAQSKNGAFLLLVPGILLLLYSAFTIWRALSEIDLLQKASTDVSEEKS